MALSSGWTDFKTAFEITPIILTGGIATGQGDGLPIVALTNPGNFDDPVTSGSSPSLDDYQFRYSPLPGSRLLKWQPGVYPFANQAIAANALIADPTNVSLIMYCPATANWPFSQRKTDITSLIASLQQHQIRGGLYTVVTPAYIWPASILLEILDVSGADNHQYQFAWQWNFYQPLTSLAAAQQAQNGLTSMLTNQTPPAGSTGWAAGSAVQNPTQAFTQSLVPAPGSAAAGSG